MERKFNRAPKGTPNDFDIRGDHAALFITDIRGAVVAEALIDIADLETVRSKGRWSQQKSNNTSYAVHKLGKSPKTYLHRFLMGTTSEIDHRNGNGLDCRRANLRFVTRTQNMQNQMSRHGSLSGHRHVHWHTQTKRWSVNMTVDGKSRSFGTYANLDDAVKIATQKRLEFHTHAREHSMEGE